MKKKIKKKNYVQTNNINALEAIKNVGTERLTDLITSFLNDEPVAMSLEEGLLLSLYIHYHRDDKPLEQSIQSFIALVLYKGVKEPDLIF